MATAAQIREHYDSLALIYRAFWGDHLHHGLFLDGHETPEQAQLRMLDYCFALAAAGNAKRALDVGCGHGGTSVLLATDFGCDVLGITLSPKQAQIARQNAYQAGVEDHVTIVADDAETFTYPPHGFGLVWAMESTEHFVDKTGFVAKAASALWRGGRLLMAAWAGSMGSERVRAVAKAFLCPELWTAEQYVQAVESAGLTLLAREDLTRKVTQTWEICRRRAQIAAPALKLMPQAVRQFVTGIELIHGAYEAKQLTYTVIAAQKP